LDRNRAALVDLMEDYATMLRWFYDANNHDEAVGIVARFLKRPPALFADWLFTKKDFYRDLDGKPDLSVVQQSIDRVQEVGFLKQTSGHHKPASRRRTDGAASGRRKAHQMPARARGAPLAETRARSRQPPRSLSRMLPPLAQNTSTTPISEPPATTPEATGKV